MTRQALTIEIAGLAVDPAGSRPLYHQLYEALRGAILAGQLRPGARLPSTRTLAAQLAVSRLTAQTAFDQLLAEGYIEGRAGSGTFVATALPDDLMEVGRAAEGTPPRRERRRARSRRSAGFVLAPTAAMRSWATPRPFRFGLPAIDAFPFEAFARLMARHWRRPAPALLGYGDPAGYRPLREAIAAYLGPARGVRCSADEVIVVAGSQQALALIGQVLLDPGDAAWVEEPGYGGAHAALLAAGAAIIPVPVDREGIDVAAGMRRGAAARVAYVTPSCQFPLGMTMSLPRRLALLEWARRTDAWIVEDDYTSEFRYTGRPLTALQGLDRDERVLYLGSFSKVLLPSLRLGYMVVPPDLVDTFIAARTVMDRQSPSVDQAVVADFMAEGHFARHIRRMRAVYAERQTALLQALDEAATDILDVAPAEAGTHIVGWLPAGVDDRAASTHAAAHGVQATALSVFARERLARGGLLLGYAALNPTAMRAGARRLAESLRDLA